MTLNNGILTVTKNELVEIIKSNPDNETDESKRMNKKILEMVERFYGRFTPKQGNWLLSKVKFIFRSMKKGTVRDFKFIDEKIPARFVKVKKVEEEKENVNL